MSSVSYCTHVLPVPTHIMMLQGGIPMLDPGKRVVMTPLTTTRHTSRRNHRLHDKPARGLRVPMLSRNRAVVRGVTSGRFENPIT